MFKAPKPPTKKCTYIPIVDAPDSTSLFVNRKPEDILRKKGKLLALTMGNFQS